jgi:hypothetical protein
VGIAPGGICSCDNRASFACHQTDFCCDGGNGHPLNGSDCVNTDHKIDYDCDMNEIVIVIQSSDIDTNVISNDFHTGHMILTWSVDVRKSQTLIWSGSFCTNVNANCCYLMHDCTSHGTEIDCAMTRLMKLLRHEAEVAVFAAAVVVVAAAVVVAVVFSSFSSQNLKYRSHCQFWGPWAEKMQQV